MQRFVLAAAAALVLTACADTGETPVAPAAPRLATGDTWRVFTTQTPAEILDATGGWEVATRFKASVPGCITELHFYRAPGETGLNYIKLWTNSGTQLLSWPVYFPVTGWNTVQLTSPPGVGPPIDSSVCIPANTYYRVSVNTNTKQAKTYDYFTTNGSITRGPLTANYSYYGQPTGSMPTQGSNSIYFVDVTFEED
jgi:hypothetical protein